MLSDNDLVALVFSDGQIVQSSVENLWQDVAYFEEMDDFAVPVVWETTGWEPVSPR